MIKQAIQALKDKMPEFDDFEEGPAGIYLRYYSMQDADGDNNWTLFVKYKKGVDKILKPFEAKLDWDIPQSEKGWLCIELKERTIT